MRRGIITFLTLFLLWILVSRLNHEITSVRLYVFLGGLFVTFAALRLERREGLLAVFAAGLLHDASAPVWFGLHALLFSAAHTFIFHFRSRVPRGEILITMLLALVANLGIFLCLAIAMMARSSSSGNAWPRFFVDLLGSQACLVLVAPWFTSLQAHALKIGAHGLHGEQRGLS